MCYTRACVHYFEQPRAFLLKIVRQNSPALLHWHALPLKELDFDCVLKTDFTKQKKHLEQSGGARMRVVVLELVLNLFVCIELEIRLNVMLMWMQLVKLVQFFFIHKNSSFRICNWSYSFTMVKIFTCKLSQCCPACFRFPLSQSPWGISFT